MDIQTKTLGIVPIKEDQKIVFKEGLFGFEEYTDFALLDSEYEPFLWLQSLQEKTLAFLVVDPFTFRPDYEIDVDDKILASIGIDNPKDVVVMVIITVPADGNVTANLQGPVIINKQNGKAKQVVLGDSRWSIKYNILGNNQENPEIRGDLC